jgi:hypothetical protein
MQRYVSHHPGILLLAPGLTRCLQQWAAPLSFTRELIEGGGQRTRTKQKTDDLVARGVVSVGEAGTLSQM